MNSLDASTSASPPPPYRIQHKHIKRLITHIKQVLTNLWIINAILQFRRPTFFGAFENTIKTAIWNSLVRQVQRSHAFNAHILIWVCMSAPVVILLFLLQFVYLRCCCSSSSFSRYPSAFLNRERERQRKKTQTSKMSPASVVDLCACICALARRARARTSERAQFEHWP